MSFPQLILGTAMWGWNVHRPTAFALLDEWYQQGFRKVDTATNYPINKNPQDFRAAENILLEWLQVNGITDVEVMMKVGSLNNLRTPDHNLTYSFLLMTFDDYYQKFGDNLHTFMLHWDNRNDETAIRATYEALKKILASGVALGLSGIKYPTVHAHVNQTYNFDFSIQIKHNLLHSDYQRYTDFHGKNRFITYGINAGGLKLSQAYQADSSLLARGGATDQHTELLQAVQHLFDHYNQQHTSPTLTTFNQAGMIYACYQPDVKAVLLGTSHPQQLKNSINFWRTLQQYDLQPLYQELAALPTP